MSKRIMILLGITMPGLAVLACSMPLSPVTPTPTTEASKTAVSSPPAASPTVTIVTPTVAATATTAPSLTSTQSPGATANPVACNWMEFIADVNYLDNTVVPAGANFVKTWRLKNIGSCTWTSGYKLLFVSGDAMSGAGSVQLTNGTVSPGAFVDASINLKAPAAGGTYQGNYKLQSSDGTTFGFGPGANNIFYVKIVVESQEAQPATPELTRNLKINMAGEDVKMLQTQLLALGYNAVGVADGKFGPKTDSAVKKFQQDKGLVVDGVVGKNTWAALWK